MTETMKSARDDLLECKTHAVKIAGDARRKPDVFLDMDFDQSHVQAKLSAAKLALKRFVEMQKVMSRA